jgi:hypothetical protein
MELSLGWLKGAASCLGCLISSRRVHVIIKTMDSRQEEMRELSSLLNEKINANQRFQIERELKAIRTGALGEEDAAYYIDFYFGEPKNWAVIHDLRIKYKGQVAQIDHILMNRMFDIYVLESKNYSYKITITPEEEFKVYSGTQHYGVPSPIEQNKRHIHLLEQFLKAKEILPKRMGIRISPRLKSFILISPKSIISRPPEMKYDTSVVIKAAMLRTKIDDELEKTSPAAALGLIGKISSSSTIEKISRRLVRYHRPHKIDWRGRFGLPSDSPSDYQNVPFRNNRGLRIEDSSQYFCFKCKKAISEKVAKFCFQNRPKFEGRLIALTVKKVFECNTQVHPILGRAQEGTLL